MAKVIFLPSPSDQFPESRLHAVLEFDELLVEPYGREFDRLLRFQSGLEPLKPDSGSDDQDEEEEDPSLAKKYEQRKRKKVLEDNYYDLLGLGDKRYLSTPDDIKKAYRKMVLLHHPDKQAQDEAEVDDELFKRIQHAYEELIDPRKKRIYDSRDPFDDLIPKAEDLVDDSAFFSVLTPVFTRNAKWSDIQPVPGVGGPETPFKEVQKFYNFWYSFKSWRDFSSGDEYDPEEAESREERRWMERRNAKERKKKELIEIARIRSLVDLAYKHDPRVKAVLQAQKQAEEERRRVRREAALARQKKEEDERNAEAERIRAEELRKQQEEENLRQEKMKETKQRRKKRQKIRALFRKYELEPGDLEYCLSRLEEDPTFDDFAAALLEVSEDPEALARVAQTKADEWRDRVERDRLEADKALKTQQQEAKSKPWTAEEIGLLAKAVVKFPGGTRDRWEKIKEFLGTGRPIKDIIARVKNQSYDSMPAELGGDQFAKWKKNVEKKINLDELSPSEQQSAVAKGANVVISTSADGAPASSDATSASAASPSASPKVEAAAPAKPAVEWTQQDQSLLEAALKRHPASLGKERWDKIAADVPGKTKKQIVDRYKYLAQLVKEKKK